MGLSFEKKQEVEFWKKQMDKEINDVQGIIRRGYKSLGSARFLLLKITEVAAAKRYFNFLAADFITSSNKNTDHKAANQFDLKKALHIAFTNTGLKELELPGDILLTFSRQFLEGMSHKHEEPDRKLHERSILLGDVGSNDPALWNWGNQGNHVDCILLLYADSPETLEDLELKCFTIPKEGVSLVTSLDTFPHLPGEDLREHFGFKDGISQPVISGFKQSLNFTMTDDDLLNPGEFILGHSNGYKSFSPTPYCEANEASKDLDFLPGYTTKKDLGKNGSYLVVRQMEQHVETFFDYVHTASKELGATAHDRAIRLASKMVGRWPEGQSLAVCPMQPCEVSGDLNQFRYHNEDRYGTGCPFGAHVRRTNPRDQVHSGHGPDLSLEMTNKHRILRRGRIYGVPLSESLKAPDILQESKKTNFAGRWITAAGVKTLPRRGIHFMCLVSDISRQFEFIQNVWANTSSFAELSDEVDPIISPRPTDDQPHCHEFTTPQDVVRNRYKKVPEFTTVLGGAYFFLPGIRALKFILR